MFDFVGKYKIHMLNPRIDLSKETDYTIEVITSTDEIPLLAKMVTIYKYLKKWDCEIDI
jgi:hypothetical protein